MSDAVDPTLARVMAEQLAYERELQQGVATYAQLIGGGWTWTRIRTAVRRRELAQVWSQVYVDHTGPLSPRQRAWAAVLHAEPAALCLDWADSLPSSGPVQLAIERQRRLKPVEGIELHRVTGLAGQIRFRTSPPRLAFEHNLLLRIQLAEDQETIVGLVADTVGRRGVTAAGLRAALELHPRLRHRALVRACLDDVESGVESVLERGYLLRVERPHRLPPPVRRAARVAAGTLERRDMEYDELGVVIELDGRLNHASWAAGNRDAARDLVDQRAGRTVLRLRWRQVMVESCATAGSVASVLRRHGWAGAPAACSGRCTAVAVWSGMVTT